MPSCLSLGCFRPSKRTLPFPGPPSACRLQNRLGVTPNADVWLNNHFIAIEFTCRAVHPFQGLSVCPQSCVAATAACSRAHASPQNEVPRPSLPIPPAPRPPVATDPPASTHACSGHRVIDGVEQCVSFGAWLLAPSLYCDVIFNCRGESFGGQARGPRHVASSPRDLGQQLYSLRPPPRGSGLGLLICKMGRSYSRHASLAQGQRLGRGALRSAKGGAARAGSQVPVSPPGSAASWRQGLGRGR